MAFGSQRCLQVNFKHTLQIWLKPHTHTDIQYTYWLNTHTWPHTPDYTQISVCVCVSLSLFLTHTLSLTHTPNKSKAPEPNRFNHSSTVTSIQCTYNHVVFPRACVLRLWSTFHHSHMTRCTTSCYGKPHTVMSLSRDWPYNVGFKLVLFTNDVAGSFHSSSDRVIIMTPCSVVSRSNRSYII